MREIFDLHKFSIVPEVVYLYCFVSALLLEAGSISTRAETFAAAAGATNQLVLATNETLMITSWFGLRNDVGRFVTQGSTGSIARQSFLYNATTIPLSGPGTLIFTNDSVISFYRATNTGVRTEIFARSTPILVREGQVLTFYRGFASDIGGFETRVQVGAVSIQANIFPSMAIVGPTSVDLRGVVSYSTNENSQVLLHGVVKGASGPFELMVERSHDLTNWFPIISHSVLDIEPRFYRLKLSR